MKLTFLKHSKKLIVGAALAISCFGMASVAFAEAKAMVDGAPKVIKEAASKDDADAAKAKLEEVGAKVTLK